MTPQEIQAAMAQSGSQDPSDPWNWRGIAANMRAPVDVTALNALTRRFATDRANLDDEETKGRLDYNTTIGDLGRRRETDFSKMSTGFADRGMTHSGAAIEGNVQLQDTHNRANAQATQGITSLLATIARKRLEAEAEFNEQRAVL